LLAGDEGSVPSGGWVWPCDFYDLLLWPGIVAACAWGVWTHAYVGTVVSFLTALAVLRTAAAIVRAGRGGFRPALWQKTLLLGQAVGEVIALGVVAAAGAAVGLFFVALAEDWGDMPDFAHISQLIGFLLLAVVAPAAVLFMYWRGAPQSFQPPGPSPFAVLVLGGIISVALVFGSLAAVGTLSLPAWTWQSPWVAIPVGLTAGLAATWCVWAAALETYCRFFVSPWRVLLLLLRGVGSVVEAAVVGFAVVATAFLIAVVGRTMGAPSWVAELMGWGAATLGAVGGPRLIGQPERRPALDDLTDDELIAHRTARRAAKRRERKQKRRQRLASQLSLLSAPNPAAEKPGSATETAPPAETVPAANPPQS
jgi:hypothetical protein